MSLSLAMRNGDLAIGANRNFEIVSGRGKLLQDLRLWVLERLGYDPATPAYGNRLDDYIEDGKEFSGFIGSLATVDTLNQIRNEIIELLQRYQTMQFEKIKQETMAYLGENTLDEDEILAVIDLVEVKSVGTTALASVRFTTLAGNPLRITFPVNGALA